MPTFLLNNLVRFTRLLRDLGVPVPAGRTNELLTALHHVDIGRRQDVYYALRTMLVHRAQDLAIFDEAFRVFWRRPPGDWSTQDLRAMGEQRRSGSPRVEAPATGSDGVPDTRTATIDTIAPDSYSGREVLRTRDFAELTERELLEAEQLLGTLRWEVGVRRTRRWRTRGNEVVDLRRLLREHVRRGHDLVELPRRGRTERPRPLVLLCDVSGSMERYTRLLLRFAYSMAGAHAHVEAFVFATRLTRITRHLQRRGLDHTVSRLTSDVPDLGGGTRMGEALGVFNRRWARRILGRGAVVLLISDGWDRGDPSCLSKEIARLQRTAHRLIWLNPLLGSPAYAPLTRGMRAALPFIDDFLPVHNLASLEALSMHLHRLPSRRPGRGRPVWRLPAGGRIAETSHAAVGHLHL